MSILDGRSPVAVPLTRLHADFNIGKRSKPTTSRARNPDEGSHFTGFGVDSKDALHAANRKDSNSSLITRNMPKENHHGV